MSTEGSDVSLEPARRQGLHVRARRLLPATPSSWAYVVGVVGLAAVGFLTDRTPAILLATLAALPLGLVALAAFYVGYGLLSQVPGTDAGASAGSGSCAPAGDCTASTAGDLAAWFVLTTDVLGVLALTAAALANVVLVRALLAGPRSRRSTGPTAG